MAHLSVPDAELKTINSVIYSWQRPEFRKMIIGALQAFITKNSNADADGEATAFDEPDDMTYILTVLKTPQLFSDSQLCAPLLEVFSLLLHREKNKRQVVGTTINTIIEVAKTCDVQKLPPAMCASACRCIFRAASVSSDNRLHLIDAMHYIIQFLRVQSTMLQETACACIQLLCASSLGCDGFRTGHGTEPLLGLLYSAHDKVLVRATAAIQTVTKDLEVCREIGLLGGILPLLVLVDHAHNAVALAAGGILQNLGRDKDTCRLLLEYNVVDHVAPLLVRDSPQLQSVAIGVMLNTHNGDEESRNALKNVLSTIVACSAIDDVLVDAVRR